MKPISIVATIGPALSFLRAGSILTACLLSLLLTGCSEPPIPPEVDLAVSQDQNLWKVGVPKYAPREYEEYAATLRAGQDMLTAERSKFIWFQDYDPVAKFFGDVIAHGEQVRTAALTAKARETTDLSLQIIKIGDRLRILRNLADDVRDKKLSTRSMARAETLLNEAKGHVKNGDWTKARRAISEANLNVDSAVNSTRKMVARFADGQQIAHWRGQVANAIQRSRNNGGYLIVVNKLDRELTLYKSGQQVKTYSAGMGINYLADKLYSGDRATPEGEYRITRKLPASKYYKAMLINYPNEEDQRRFAEAKRRGEISKRTHIGGLIEIHGGGTAGLTYGCVALDDRHILELYNTVEVGTPVVIVGALSANNSLCSTLDSLCNAN
ncbi:MAG: murein L,D-transpeptidase [Desulfuromonas sp.]|nr:murein L,D-transpeptidase [Desulfuromonas sp.]